MNLGLYLPTDWRIVTAGGGEIDFGLSVDHSLSSLEAVGRYAATGSAVIR